MLMNKILLYTFGVIVLFVVSIHGNILVVNAASIVAPYDKIPNFCQTPTISATASGNWSSASTWSGNRVPTSSDTVMIPAGATVTVDSTNAVADNVCPNGELNFATNVNTQLKVTTLLVYDNGSLKIGTQSNPISPNVTAKIVIADKPIDTTIDPSQYGHGLLGLGAVTMHGAKKNPTFVRLATEPKAGDTSFQFSEPVSGWSAGDKMYLPDTRQPVVGATSPDQSETVTLNSVAADGKSAAFSPALQFNHLGARNADGVVEILPHVANLTRNVIIDSENLNGVRGHVLFTYRANIDVRYVEVDNGGRTVNGDNNLDSTTFDSKGNVAHIGTNQIGRYPLHMHHLIGPFPTVNSYQYMLVGNVVQNASKWGITIHDSHFGDIEDNVLYGTPGAGIMTESGNETENVIKHNFVSKTPGTGRRADIDKGTQGGGLWLSGQNNRVNGNVVEAPGYASGGNYVAFELFNLPGNQPVPLFQGADNSKAGQYKLENMQTVPVLEFGNSSQPNEAGGRIKTCLETWFFNASYTDNLGGPHWTVGPFRCWHNGDSGYAMFAYPGANGTYDGFVHRGDYFASAPAIGLNFADYLQDGIKVIHADLQNDTGAGFSAQVGPAGQSFEDSKLRSFGIGAGTIWNCCNSKAVMQRKAVIKNVVWSLPHVQPSQANPISRTANFGDGRNAAQSDKLFVCDYQGKAGDNFEVFYQEQRDSFIIPQTAGQFIGCPSAGMTNTQCKQTHGVAIAGAIAPCTTTRSGIVGAYVCVTPDVANVCSSQTNTNTNIAPNVDAGSNQTISPGSTATLNGFASDDGLPNPPGTLTVAWSKVSGPGTVAFSNANNSTTTVTFSQVGNYLLRLTASDSALSSFSDVTVTVSSTTNTTNTNTTENNSTTTTTTTNTTNTNTTEHSNTVNNASVTSEGASSVPTTSSSQERSSGEKSSGSSNASNTSGSSSQSSGESNSSSHTATTGAVEITRTLSRGVSGDDVKELQHFLIGNNLLFSQATGFFGRLTEGAVKKFQCSEHIVCSGGPASTGFGVVGPKTRKELKNPN